MGAHNACSYADLARTNIDHKILGQTMSHFHQIGQDFEMTVLALADVLALL